MDYSPGLRGVVAGETEISTVGMEGTSLRYRGYDAIELTKTHTYEDVASLIIDDNLDYFGGKKIGKVIGQDFLEGKVTLPIILLLKRINKDQKEKINTLFQKKKRTIKELKEIIKLLQKYEIEQECREYAEKISVKSLIILNNFKNKQSQLLKELLVTSLKRES